MIIDTHCHYNLHPLVKNIDHYWQKAQNNGVKKSIVVGTNLATSVKAVNIANKFSNLYASIGVHPYTCNEAIKTILNKDIYSQEKIDQWINNNQIEISTLINKELKNNKSKLVAIGEIGLDYYKLKKKGLKRRLVVDMQKKLFKTQLEIAMKNNLVAILHVRDQESRKNDNAYFDIIKIIKQLEKKFQKIPKLIFHCISGPETYMQEVISFGSYIGIAGNITYDNAQNLRNIVKNFPREKLLLETDAPYLTPTGFNSQICEPHMIKNTANFLQQSLGINLDIITNNTINLFSDKFNRK